MTEFEGVNIDTIHYKMTTKKEKDYYGKLANFGCVLCHLIGFEGIPAEIHHIRNGNIPRKQAPVIPLCFEHHRGNFGVHSLGKKGKFEARYGIDEQALLTFIEEQFGENPVNL
jgi:hypothetical protein